MQSSSAMVLLSPSLAWSPEVFPSPKGSVPCWFQGLGSAHEGRGAASCAINPGLRTVAGSAGTAENGVELLPYITASSRTCSPAHPGWDSRLILHSLHISWLPLQKETLSHQSEAE